MISYKIQLSKLDRLYNDLSHIKSDEIRDPVAEEIVYILTCLLHDVQEKRNYNDTHIYGFDDF